MRRARGLILSVLVGPLVLVPATMAGGRSMALSQELDANYSYTGGGDMHRGSTDYENVTEQHADVTYVVSPQVSKDLLLRFGVEWQFFYFGNTGQMPLPNVLQQINATLGFDCQFGDQWLMRLEVRPGIYCSSFDDVTGRDFDAPLVIGGTYLANPDLQWVFGVLIDVRSQYPVLPAPGVRWQFADQWVLNGIFPRPRLEYRWNENLELYTGLDFVVNTYTVGAEFGQQHDLPKLNNATLDYFEYRTGVGCSWKIRPNLTVEAEAGALLGRWVSYVHEDVVLRSQPAPYFQLICHARF